MTNSLSRMAVNAADWSTVALKDCLGLKASAGSILNTEDTLLKIYHPWISLSWHDWSEGEFVWRLGLT